MTEPLDFEAVERQLNMANLADMEREVTERSPRLATRIAHFQAQFGIDAEDFWHALEADPQGPLAAVLAREARRQNVHEKAVEQFIKGLAHVENLRKLPSTGPRACYINADGQVVTGQTLLSALRPSKSIDFQWQTGTTTCYAAQKYTKEGGGTQDNEFNELVRLLQNFQRRTTNGIALFALVDGGFYDVQRLNRLRALTRNQAPHSFVISVNALQTQLLEMMTSHTG